MMNRPGAVSFSKLSTSEHDDGTIPVVAEYVTAVAEHEEPSSSILPHQKASSILEQGRLTWTDDFFERQDDIVAVFDYDLETLKKIMVEEKFGWAKGFYPMIFAGTIFWCMATDGPFLVVVFCGSLLLMVVFASIRHAEATMPVVDSWLHTAVTQTGLRHVQTRTTPQDVLPAGAFVLDIPFENIISIKRTRLLYCIYPRNHVLLTLASTNGDGLEFISSGDRYFQSVSPSQVCLALTNLKEPVLFMKVLQAMMDKSSVARKSSSSKAAELLCRVEKFLDNCSERLLDRNVDKSLRELVVEMRELNNNNNNTSSSIEQHDVATIV